MAKLPNKDEMHRMGLSPGTLRARYPLIDNQTFANLYHKMEGEIIAGYSFTGLDIPFKIANDHEEFRKPLSNPGRQKMAKYPYHRIDKETGKRITIVSSEGRGMVLVRDPDEGHVTASEAWVKKSTRPVSKVHAVGGRVRKTANPTRKSSERMVGEFDVFLRGKHIDTVFFSPGQTAGEVRSSLINHDGYDPRISVVGKSHAGRKARNPTPNHAPGADEIAAYLRSVDRSGDLLSAHLRKTAAKPGFDRERYGEFLAKTHMTRAAEGYYGSKLEAKRFATLATRRVAGEIFVDHILSGEWE